MCFAHNKFLRSGIKEDDAAPPHQLPRPTSYVVQSIPCTFKMNFPFFVMIILSFSSEWEGHYGDGSPTDALEEGVLPRRPILFILAAWQGGCAEEIKKG
ncbi:hypothetical protein SLE2022_012930 [Rubroshorea leprosula]